MYVVALGQGVVRRAKLDFGTIAPGVLLILVNFLLYHSPLRSNKTSENSMAVEMMRYRCRRPG